MTEPEIIPPGAPLHPPVRQSTPVLGILSLVLGAIAFIPLLGLFSILAFVFGVLALLFGQVVTGILGTALAVVGMFLSPTVWLLGACLIGQGLGDGVCGFESFFKTLEGPAAVYETHPKTVDESETEEL